MNDHGATASGVAVGDMPAATPPVVHDHYTDDYIRSILADVKTVAVVGGTDNNVRPSYFVLRYLIGKGYRVIPINPGLAGKEILGQRVYASLAEVPEPIDMVDIFRRQDALSGVVDEALALSPTPKVIWMQLGLRDDAAAARAEARGARVVMNRCVKIEYGRLCGEIAWTGVNSRVLSSKKPVLASGYQHFTIGPKK
jgi:predicted CoA-binding protein